MRAIKINEGLSILTGIVLAFFTIFLEAVNIPIGILFFISIGILLFFYFRSILIVFFIVVIIFQNTLIGLNSSFIVNPLNYKILLGTNFLLPHLIILYAITYYYWKREIKLRKLVLLCILGYLILIPFTLIGIFFYDFVSAISYFRLFATPFLFLVCGFIFGNLPISESILKKVIFGSLILLIVTSIIGKFFPDFMFYIFNERNFYSFKYLDPNIAVQDYIESNTKNFLNLKFLNIPTFRYNSILKNAISFSYVIILLSILVSNWKKTYRYLYITGFVVLLISSSKGALLLVVIIFIVKFISGLKQTFTFGTLVLILIPLWVGIIFIGNSLNNEHIIGFIEGTRYLYKTPLGNGLGFSGNLSQTQLSSIFGPPLEDLGYWTRFQNGSESAIGVLFSSLGIFSIVYLLILLAICKSIFSRMRKSYPVLSILPLLLIFQGIFQEEAFSPYSIGITMFFAAFYYSKFDSTNNATLQE